MFLSKRAPNSNVSGMSPLHWRPIYYPGGASFMDDAKRELVRAWLIKAQNDLTTARQVSGHVDGPLDTAIYHCQQAAEKAVKGFLAFHDHRLERSHDVQRLLELAEAYDARFG